MSANFGSLGITGYSNADAAIDQNFGQMQASAIQSLGAQVRSDIDQIMTTRAVRNMVPALQQLRPGDPDFPQQAAGVIAQNPLALRHPAGKAAIELLGKAHIQAEREDQLRAAGGSIYDPVTKKWITPPPRPEGTKFMPGTSPGAMVGGVFKTREELGATGLPDPETPEEKRAGELESKIKFEKAKASLKKGTLKTIKNADGSVNYHFDTSTGEHFTEEDLGMPETIGKPTATKSSRPSVSHIKAMEDYNSELITVERKLAEATENNGVTAEGESAMDLLRKRKGLLDALKKLNLNEQPGIPGLPQAEAGSLMPPNVPEPRTLKQFKFDLNNGAMVPK